MAANVFATPVRLYLAPTTAGTGGTLIDGVEERLVEFASPSAVKTYRTGIGAGAGFVTYRGMQEQARLVIPLRQQDSAALKILFSHLTTDGTTFRPTGGTATKQHRALPSFALVARPILSTEKHLYAPKWRLSEEIEQAWRFSNDLPQLDGNVLVLLATKDPGDTVPPWMLDTAANINTAYSLSA
jgi:hypothetical protein